MVAKSNLDKRPLLEGRCEIWIASIPEFTEHQGALDDVLTPDERAHVHSIREGRATARLSRGLLRLVLARYLNLPPAEIEIDRSCPDCGRSHGRPRLRSRPEAATEASKGDDPLEPPRGSAAVGAIEFSVTHGGDLLVLAFADSAPVGVDVEPIGALEDGGVELLDFTLTAAERVRLLEAPAPQRRRIFLQHWTGKEAILKALGTGLDVEPQAVSLPQFPIKGKASVKLPGSPPVDLWISDVEVGPAHVCTLATGQEVRELRSARLSPSFILGHKGQELTQ
jgi:4'-phosphopantetheinyl transferase